MSGTDLAIGYWLGIGFFIFAGIVLQPGTPPQRREGARMIFLSPIWPALLLSGAVKVVRALWRIADFKGKNK